MNSFLLIAKLSKSLTKTAANKLFTMIRSLLGNSRRFPPIIKRYASAQAVPSPAKVNLTPVEKIRNVAIIAHVDHGKTSLVDCLLKQSDTHLGSLANETRVMDCKL